LRVALLALEGASKISSSHVMICFPDAESERRALGFLAGRFSFKRWSTGETVLLERALPALAAQGIHFSMQGPATYERLVP
jgi:hypothetical protein